MSDQVAELVRATARRLVLELGLIAVLLLAGLVVPVGDPPGSHWSLLLPFTLFVAHMLVGLLVLVDAARLLRRSREVPPDGRLLIVIGLAASVLVVATGAVSVLGVVDRSPGALMVFAWSLAVVVYGRLWISADSLLRARPGPGPRSAGRS